MESAWRGEDNGWRWNLTPPARAAAPAAHRRWPPVLCCRLRRRRGGSGRRPAASQPPPWPAACGIACTARRRRSQLNRVDAPRSGWGWGVGKGSAAASNGARSWPSSAPPRRGRHPTAAGGGGWNSAGHHHGCERDGRRADDGGGEGWLGTVALPRGRAGAPCPPSRPPRHAPLNLGLLLRRYDDHGLGGVGLGAVSHSSRAGRCSGSGWLG